MILEVQIQIFYYFQCARVKVFIFKKFQGAQIWIFFDKNWHAAFLYIRKQTQKYKFEVWLLKSTMLDPPKKALLAFEENPPKKNFSSCFDFDSALKTIDAQMFCWSVFFKMHKKSYWLSKKLFWPFLAVHNVFFVRFQKNWSFLLLFF